MNNKNKLSDKRTMKTLWENEHSIIIISAAIVLLSYILFSYAGIKTMGFWVMFYIIPPYFIFRHFELDRLESFVFSIFAGAGVLPTVVFFLNFIIPSLRWSAVIVFAVEVLVAVYLYLYAKTEKN